MPPAYLGLRHEGGIAKNADFSLELEARWIEVSAVKEFRFCMAWFCETARATKVYF